MEQFYNARKRARKKANYRQAPINKVETVQISTLACWLFLAQFFDKQKTQTVRKPGADFNVMTIDNNNPLRCFINTLLVDYEISVARIYEFVPQQKNCAHIDHLFPDREVVIIRLNNGDSRLKINSKLVSESVGKGYIFPSDTLYEILQGKKVRYSLVLWGSRKVNNVCENHSAEG
jgi:hypothetical protein